MQIDAIQKIHVSRWNENCYTHKNSYFVMKYESIEKITDSIAKKAKILRRIKITK